MVGKPSFRGKADAGRSRPKGHNAQLKELSRWSWLFSFVSAAVVGVSIFVGAWAPTWVSVVATTVVFIVFWSVNGSTVKRMHHDVWPQKISLPRRALGLCTAVFVAFSMVFWLFGDEIEAARGERAAIGWDQDSGRLRQELDRQRQLANREVLPVDQYPEVDALAKKLAGLEAERVKASDNELCELDGKCGTQEQGKGDAYYEKKERRLRIEKDIEDVKVELGTARTAAQAVATTLTGERDGAKARTGELDERLGKLGPRPEVRNRFAALSSVDSWKRYLLAPLWFGMLGSYFAVDVLALQWVVRRVCHLPGQRAGSSKKLTEAQAKEAERNSKGAISAGEYFKREGGE